MKDENYLSLGMVIKQAREEKSLTINDLAFQIDKNNVGIYEKKIKQWEKEKDYPDLNEIYQLCYILEVNPEELIILRDRHRKNLKKTNGEKKYKKIDWDKFSDNLEIGLITFARFFVLIACLIFIYYYCKVFISATKGYGPTSDENIDKTIGNVITNYMNELEDNEI